MFCEFYWIAFEVGGGRISRRTLLGMTVLARKLVLPVCFVERQSCCGSCGDVRISVWVGRAGRVG